MLLYTWNVLYFHSIRNARMAVILLYHPNAKLVLDVSKPQQDPTKTTLHYVTLRIKIYFYTFDATLLKLSSGYTTWTL